MVDEGEVVWMVDIKIRGNFKEVLGICIGHVLLTSWQHGAILDFVL